MLGFRLVSLFCAMFFAIFQTTLPASAHRQAESYVFFSVTDEALTGRIEATLDDINRLVPLDKDGDQIVTQQEFEARSDEVFSFFASRLSIISDGQTYAISPMSNDFLKVGFGTFAQLSFAVEGLSPTPEFVDVRYVPLTDVSNPGHLGFGLIENNTRTGVTDNETYISMIFEADGESQRLSLIGDPWHKVFVDFVVHGVWHIWIGLDHILFIVALILPAVVRRRKEEDQIVETNTYSNVWEPVKKFRPAFLYILKIITFFTIAHSITLALAALGVINLSSRFVESVIAISIALAAYHNIQPIFKGKEWIIAFGFGLFHGFGFASVLGEKGISGDFLVPSLLGFNLGVEIGQVLIICLIFPVLFLIRKNKVYPKIITFGSIALIFIALYWAVERAFEVDLTIGTYFWKIYNSIFG